MVKSLIQKSNSKIGLYKYVGPFGGGQEFPVMENTKYEISKTMISGERGHYGFPDFPSFRNVGGPFNLIGYETSRPSIGIPEIYKTLGQDTVYTGSVNANVSNAAPTAGLDYNPGNRGAEAYKKMKPGKPNMQGLNALLELRDLPSMLKQGTKHISDIGNYWLALKFGWGPLLSDLRKCFEFQQKAEKTLKQLLRDNGRPVRRRVILQDEILDVAIVTDNGTNGLLGFNPIMSAGWHINPTWKETRTSGARWWASAQFRYHLPDGPKDIAWKQSMKRELFSLYPTPVVIYNAIPWTWLIDWFTNLGDVIDNLQTTMDGRLAADYFYMMREKYFVNEIHSKTSFNTRTQGVINIQGTAQSIGSAKSRVAGDPFGFNTNENQLNGMQLSILGALGLSRLR